MRKNAFAYKNDKPQPPYSSLKERVFEEIPARLAVVSYDLKILFANAAFCSAARAQAAPPGFLCKACRAGPCNVPLPLDAAFAKHRDRKCNVTNHKFRNESGEAYSLRISGLQGEDAFLLLVDQDVEAESPKQREETLLCALNHRISNALQVAKLLASQTARHSESGEDFLRAYEGRLSAFAEAHAEVARNLWGYVPLETLVHQAAAVPSAGQRVRILPSPAVDLPPQDALSLRLAFHELLTNALQHGSLSKSSGRVDISWKVMISNEPEIRFLWKESGGPAALPPQKKGFGFEFLETILPFDVNGRVTPRFGPEGFQCEVQFPLPKGGRIPWA